MSSGNSHIISGNYKEGFLLKCVACEKEWKHIYSQRKFCNECLRNKKIKYAKENNPMNRPEIREKHKKKMKEDMSGKNNPLHTNPNALENLRKTNATKESRKKKSEGTKLAYKNGTHPMCFEVNILKSSKSNSKSHEHVKNFREYNEVVQQETRISLIKHKKHIKNYELRGKRHGYELDHKFSVSEGFNQKIDPKVIGHWKNLEIITRLENDIKWAKCSITLEELMKLIEEDGE